MTSKIEKITQTERSVLFFVLRGRDLKGPGVEMCLRPGRPRFISHRERSDSKFTSSGLFPHNLRSSFQHLTDRKIIRTTRLANAATDTVGCSLA